jgi:hypothetical protein
MINWGNGKRLMHFSNSVVNRGSGVLELHGVFDPLKNTILVSQYLYGFDKDLVQRRVGAFTFHPAHGHWHWADFSIYEILPVRPDGRLGEVLVTSGKVGYCMLDIQRMPAEWGRINLEAGLEIVERAQYGVCNWRRQGISIGWVDTYDANTPGQVMDISRLSDGIYALRSTVDPQGKLFEAERGNNTGMVYFALQGSLLYVIGESIPAHLRAPERNYLLDEGR